ncbi:MAG: TRAP transporter substrate-binding protein [Rhodomicrobium sp.]|jgi:tripartite ATP-independent transporter DctP family solute receptor
MSIAIRMRFLACAFLLVAGILSVAPAAMAAEPTTLHFGHIGAPGSLYWLSAEEFAQRVDKLSRGTIRIALHPNSELGSDSAVAKKLLTGEADLSILATPMSSIASEFGVFEMPFLVRNRAHVRRFRDAIMQSYLKPAAEQKGYRVLAMWELGFRHIINNKRAIEGPGSLAGLKLRVPQGEWRIKMFKAYGVEPIPMEFKDVIPGIEAGRIDGLETPLDLIYGAHIERVQKYLTLSYHVYSAGFLVMGRDRYQQLPISVRAVIEKVAVEMQDWVLQTGDELDAEFVDKLKPFVAVNEADRLAFTIQSVPIYSDYTKLAVHRALVKLIFEADASPLATAP